MNVLLLLATTAVAPMSPIAVQDRDPIPISLKLVADNLTSPLWLLSPPDGTHRRFIVEQRGKVRILMPDGTMRKQLFIDLGDKLVPARAGFDERGLLGLAFHPDYATNGRFFVFYSAPLRAGGPTGFNCTTTISEFHVSSDPNVADASSERIMLQVDKPQFNHNGGAIAFGPDGYLYLTIGDGGAANDAGNGHNPLIGNAQDITILLGKILRLDVNGAMPYAIPADNPFVGRDGADEIYAYGFRNPYRASFDMGGSHDLFVGDAGQNLWEEVSIARKGGNFGWRLMEGTHGFDPAHPNVSPPPPVTGYLGEPLINPIIEYPNSNTQPGVGLVVVGGVVYRGGEVPSLRGRYIFADWSTGFATPDGTLLMALPLGNSGSWAWRQLMIKNSATGRIGAYITGFGQDDSGEVYVLTNGLAAPTGTTGKIYKLAKPGAR